MTNQEVLKRIRNMAIDKFYRTPFLKPIFIDEIQFKGVEVERLKPIGGKEIKKDDWICGGF